MKNNYSIAPDDQSGWEYALWCILEGDRVLTLRFCREKKNGRRSKTNKTEEE